MAPDRIVFNVKNLRKVPVIVHHDGTNLNPEQLSISELSSLLKVPLWKAKEVAYILEDAKINFTEDEVDHTVVVSYDPNTRSLIYSWAKPNKYVDKYSRKAGTLIANKRCDNIKNNKYVNIYDIDNGDQLEYIIPKSVYNNFLYYTRRGLNYFHDQPVENVKIFSKIYDPEENSTHCFIVIVDINKLGL